MSPVKNRVCLGQCRTAAFNPDARHNPAWPDPGAEPAKRRITCLDLPVPALTVLAPKQPGPPDAHNMEQHRAGVCADPHIARSLAVPGETPGTQPDRIHAGHPPRSRVLIEPRCWTSVRHRTDDERRSS